MLPPLFAICHAAFFDDAVLRYALICHAATLPLIFMPLLLRHLRHRHIRHVTFPLSRLPLIALLLRY